MVQFVIPSQAIKICFCLYIYSCFQFNAAAQNLASALIQPQFITIDPQDEDLSSKTEPLELDPETELITFTPPKIKINETYNITCTEALGFTQFYGDINLTSRPPAVQALTATIPSFKMASEDLPLEIISSNLMLINDLKLTFFIENDVLILVQTH